MKIDPPYDPITQKPYCCVPACLLMILERREIDHESQEEIGYKLGLTVPGEDKDKFDRVRTGEKPGAGWGTQIQKDEFSLKKYLAKNNISLELEYYPPDEVDDPKEFIRENLREGRDMLIFFHYKTLYGGVDNGHVSLIQAINDGEVTLVDPGMDVSNFRRVDLSDLMEAMEVHAEHSGGFWVFHGINSTTN